MKRILNPLLNDKIIGLLIVINAVIIVVLGFKGFPFRKAIEHLDLLITLIFVCEISYKIYVHKKDFFKSKGNWFDASIVFISFVSLLLYKISGETGLLENLVILRTFRLFKIFRVMRIVPDIDTIYSNFNKAVRVTSGILTGGLVILIIVGVILCSLFGDNENFSDPIVSMYSVFRLFTVEGWYDIPDDMVREGIPYLNATFIRIGFSAVVLFGMFILGFIISSISDKLAEDNNDELIEKTNELEKKIDLLNEKIDLLISKNNNTVG